jgi:nucleoside-diphosphate-sugar epimerase
MEVNHGHIHIMGCGNIGQRVASLCLDVKMDVEAWVKSEVSCRTCRGIGLKTHRIDLDQPVDFKLKGTQNQILYTIAPPPHGSKDTRLENYLSRLSADTVSRFVLISTTGVYGDCGGRWVDETTPIKPRADRALRRAHAEACLQAWADHHSVDYLILRVPGIYARDCLPLKRLQAGTPVVTPEQAPWSNRIHADDLASICFSALNSQLTHEIINVADDAPGSMTEFFFAVADFAGLPRPPEISLNEARRTLSPGMLSYIAESRRIRNTKMKKLLNISLRYPDLKQGLSSGN